MYGLMDWSGHNPADSRQCCIIAISTDESQDGVKTDSHTCTILVRSYAACQPYQRLSVLNFLSNAQGVCLSRAVPINQSIQVIQATPTLRAIHQELSPHKLFGAEELLLQLRARHKFIKGCQERAPEQVSLLSIRSIAR